MKITTLLLVFTSLIWSGCGLTFETSRATIFGNESDRKYGPPPPPDYHLTEQKLVLAELKNPEGATFAFCDAHKEVVAEGIIAPKVIAVWVSQVKSYPKTDSGSYSAPEIHLFAWKFGRIVASTITVRSEMGDALVWNDAVK